MPKKPKETDVCGNCGDRLTRGDVKHCSKDCWRAHRNALAERRFMDKVEVINNGCWLWVASKDPNGYGYFYLDGKHIRSHRASLKLFKKEAPKGAHVCHKCDNPSCVNPEHLFISDAKGNMEDKVDKNRQGRTFNVEKSVFWDDDNYSIESVDNELEKILY